MSGAIHCPVSDHDGALVPVTRQILARKPGSMGTFNRCAYCAEGQVARLLREGFEVTIRPSTPARLYVGPCLRAPRPGMTIWTRRRWPRPWRPCRSVRSSSRAGSGSSS